MGVKASVVSRIDCLNQISERNLPMNCVQGYSGLFGRMGDSMVSFSARLAKFETAKKAVETLVADGVDLMSEAASATVLEFIYALNDLAQEFGYKVTKLAE